MTARPLKPEEAARITDADRLRQCRAAYRETQVRMAALEEHLARQVRHERCYRARDFDGGWVHIPMCWGAAIGGPDQCQCDYPKTRRERELEEEVHRLREEVAHHREARRQFWERLQNQGAMLKRLLAKGNSDGDAGSRPQPEEA